uniref:Uncharacterized protein n=1 Tax=Arion vulgaris TaxID=1028688 RepID=A0A0B6ZV55_9EUPU
MKAGTTFCLTKDNPYNKMCPLFDVVYLPGTGNIHRINDRSHPFYISIPEVSLFKTKDTPPC